MVELFVLCAVACGILLLPLLLIGAAIRVLFALIALPFKLLGAAAGAVASLLGLLAKLLLGLAGLVVGLLLLVGGVIAIPLLPVLLLVGVVWLLVRLFRPRPQLAT